MSSKPMEVFPDLHHKMSKKIAQLTKVIYHLNTKNEDHQTELEIVSSNHQAEIQQILRDAATRIGKFKEVIENKQASINQDAKLEKLQKKHDLEKENALKEFANFKSKMNERDTKINQIFQKKYDILQQEIENMNKKFITRIDEFEAINSNLKKSLEEASKHGNSSMNELKKKYEKEIEDVIRSNNEKYQQMLLTQLNIQNELKAEMESQLSALKASLESQHLKTLEVELGKERARLGGDKQEALMSLRRELEDLNNKQKIALEGQIHKIDGDLKSKVEECSRIQSIADMKIAELNKKILSLQQSLNDQVGGQEILVQSLSDDLKANKEQNTSLQAKIIQRDEELSTMKAMLNEKNSMIVQIENKLAVSESEINRLKLELDNIRKSGASSADELQQKLNTALRESESYRTEINQMGSTLATVRDELRKAEKNAQKAAQDSLKAMEALNHDKEMLQNKIQELRQQIASISTEAGTEIDTLKQNHVQQLDNMKKAHMKALEESEQLLARIKENHRLESESAIASKQALLDSFNMKEKDWNDEMTSLKSQYATDLASLEQQHRIYVEETIAKHEIETQNLKSCVSALESQLQNISEQADIEKNALKNDIAKWEGKAKNYQKELENRKKESERAESVMNGLKNQVESLREELKASQKAFRDKMDMSQAKLEAEWQARLDIQIDESNLALANLRKELLQNSSEDLEKLINRHDEDMQELKNLLQKEQNQFAKELADYEKIRLDLEADLQAEKLAHVTEVSQLNTAHATHTREIEENHRQELERVKKELKNNAEQRELSASQLHAAEIERLNQLLEGTTVEYTQRMASALESSKANAEEILRQSLADLEARMKKEKRDALEDQSRDHSDATRLLIEKYDQEKNTLSNHIKDITQQFTDASTQIQNIEKVLSSERQERQRREEHFVLEKDQLERAHESDIRREKESSERKILEVITRANTDIDILKQEHLEVRHQHDLRIQDMIGQYKALEQRYLNRESREDDLKRIEQLTREMIEKDELVVRTREEMMYFKREMLNREENYNQKFGNSPNVGVMQVIKPKEINNTGSNNNKAKPTQMRVINTNGNGGIGGNMMLPGMMGVGGNDLGGIKGNKK